MTDLAFQTAVNEALDELRFQIADMKRRSAMVVRPGTVTSYDASTNTAVCDVGLPTHAVDHGTHVSHWNPLVAGQQVMLLCPDGDLANAQIVPGGYCQGFKPPSDRADEQALVPPGGGADEKAAVRIRQGGLVRIEVPSIDKMKLLIGDQAFKLKMSAIEPTEKD